MTQLTKPVPILPRLEPCKSLAELAQHESRLIGLIEAHNQNAAELAAMGEWIDQERNRLITNSN